SAWSMTTNPASGATERARGLAVPALGPGRHDHPAVPGRLLVVPALLLVALFLLAPLALIVRYSLDQYDPIRLLMGVLGWQNYLQVFTDPFYQCVLGTTAKIAGVSTVATLALAIPVAYCISRAHSERARSWLVILVVLPLLLGNAVRSAAWMLVMGTKGVANSFLITVGLTAEPLAILYTPLAVVVALVSVLLPFAIITLQSV